MRTDSTDIYFVMAPKGSQVIIPKEVFEAFRDFINPPGRYNGSLTLKYHGGAITHVESLARRRVAKP